MIVIEFVMECRNCGEKYPLYNDPISGRPITLNGSKTEVIEMLKKGMVDSEKQILHECVDGVLGIADAIGIKLKEK